MSSSCRKPETGLDLAPRSSGKEDSSSWKPFVGTLRVTNPARQSWASSRKRVLRGGWATPPAKRRQRGQRPCDRAPKYFILREPSSLVTCGGRAEATDSWSTQPAWSCRGRRTGRMDTRVPQEPGRPCRFHRNAGWGTGPTNSRLIHELRPEPVGTNTGDNDGIAKRRKRSAARRTAGSRSVP